MTPLVVSADRLLRRFAAPKTALLCWLSFEDRSIAALSVAAKTSGIDIFSLRYVDVEYELRDVLRAAQLRARSRIKNETVLERDNQFKTLATLEEKLNYLSPKYRKIYIDISCFPREAVLMLVYALSKHTMGDRISFVYNIAEDYSIQEKQKDKWLGRGMRTIAPVLGFSGRMVPGRQLALIGLVGMDEERFIRLVEALEPSTLLVGIGAPTSPDKAWLTADGQRIARKLKAVIPSTRSFKFSCESLESAFNALARAHKGLLDYNIALVTLNNKISTLAAGVFALKNREIQICSAPALIYNYTSYSSPGSSYMIFDDRHLFSALRSKVA